MHAAGGEVDWKKVVLPAGRSKAACYQQYLLAKQQATQIAMNDGVSPTTAPQIKKRAKATTGEGIKRKRGAKSKVQTTTEDDDEEISTKKQRTESEEDGEGDGNGDVEGHIKVEFTAGHGHEVRKKVKDEV